MLRFAPLLVSRNEIFLEYRCNKCQEIFHTERSFKERNSSDTRSSEMRQS